MAKKAKFSKAFLQVFGASLAATEGKSAEHFQNKRVRSGKTARDHRK